jgi:hypothetical protein
MSNSSGPLPVVGGGGTGDMNMDNPEKMDKSLQKENKRLKVRVCYIIITYFFLVFVLSVSCLTFYRGTLNKWR